ncbi:MAG: FUSC family protein [Candidatus Nanopelagicales bacterium]
MVARSNQPSALQQLWQSSIDTPAPQSGWPSATRRGLTVALVVAVGAATGHLAEGAIAGIGALNIGYIDGVVPRRTLTNALLLTGLGTTVLAFVAALLAGTWWIVPLLALLAFTYGTFAASGLVAMNASLTTLISALVFSNDPGDWRNALHLATWVFVGCLVAGLSSLMGWRFERESELRRGIVNVIAALRSLTLETGARHNAHLTAARSETDVETLLAGARLSPRRNAGYALLIQQLNWTRLCVTNWLRMGSPTATQRYAVAGVLEQIEADVRRSLRPPHAMAALTDAGLRSADSEDRNSGETWTILVEQLNGLLHAGYHFAEGPEVAGPLDANTLAAQGSVADRADEVRGFPEWFQSIRSLFAPSTPSFSHGLRLALAIGIGEVLTIGFDIPRGYWIGITIAFIVKPDFATTINRSILRIAGTVASVLFVTLVIDFTSDPGWVTVFLLIVFAPSTMRWATGNYGFATFFMSTTILVLVEATNEDSVTVILRLQNTMIGVAIGVLIYLLWPSWKGKELPRLLRTTLVAHRNWATAVLDAVDDPAHYDGTAIRALGQAAKESLLAARPAAESALVEPHHTETDPAAALTLLDACMQAATATFALEAKAREDHDQGIAGTSGTWDSTALREHLDVGYNRATSALLTPGRGVETVRAQPADVDVDDAIVSVDIISTGDQVTDRAMGMLLAATDSAAAAARCL